MPEQAQQLVDTFGNVYKGDTYRGMRHGKGVMVYATTRDVYQGDFDNDLPHGAGRYCKGSDQEYVFEGLWEHGVLKQVKKGKAVLKDDAGNIYNGTFLNWQRHGQGKLTNPNGEKYKGQFQNGKKHGYGAIYYPDGTVYEGYFKDDSPQANNLEHCRSVLSVGTMDNTVQLNPYNQVHESNQGQYNTTGKFHDDYEVSHKNKYNRESNTKSKMIPPSHGPATPTYTKKLENGSETPISVIWQPNESREVRSLNSKGNQLRENSPTKREKEESDIEKKVRQLEQLQRKKQKNPLIEKDMLKHKNQIDSKNSFASNNTKSSKGSWNFRIPSPFRKTNKNEDSTASMSNENSYNSSSLSSRKVTSAPKGTRYPSPSMQSRGRAGSAPKQRNGERIPPAPRTMKNVPQGAITTGIRKTQQVKSNKRENNKKLIQKGVTDSSTSNGRSHTPGASVPGDLSVQTGKYSAQHSIWTSSIPRSNGDKSTAMTIDLIQSRSDDSDNNFFMSDSAKTLQATE